MVKRLIKQFLCNHKWVNITNHYLQETFGVPYLKYIDECEDCHKIRKRDTRDMPGWKWKE